MCVAAVIYTPVSSADLALMEAEFPHGGGVAWQLDGEIHFQKGLTADEIFDLQESGALTYPYLLHLRWATHGTIIPELTHPFVVGPRALYGELAGTAPKVVIHNGVWSRYQEWLPLPEVPEALVENTSDTAIAAYLMDQFPELPRQVAWSVATMTAHEGQPVIRRWGTWTKKDGNLYSNLNWVPRPPVWKDSREEWGGWNWPSATDAARENWRDYVRARYGNEAAEAISDSDVSTDALETAERVRNEVAEQSDETGAELWEAQLAAIGDMGEDDASEAFEIVNSFLAKEMLHGD